MTNEMLMLQEVCNRLTAVESRLDTLLDRQMVKEWYSIAEVASLLGKAEFTVREWARLKRIHAEKHRTGRGPHNSWVVSHEELLRLQREGLLPLDDWPIHPR